jgi:hypothetical protein
MNNAIARMFAPSEGCAYKIYMFFRQAPEKCHQGGGADKQIKE